jgi:alpha-ketoglutarate-dependent taurine dioxygenase
MALEINRLTYALGAKVRGVDLRDPLDTDTVAQIRRVGTSGARVP